MERVQERVNDELEALDAVLMPSPSQVRPSPCRRQQSRQMTPFWQQAYSRPCGVCSLQEAPAATAGPRISITANASASAQGTQQATVVVPLASKAARVGPKWVHQVNDYLAKHPLTPAQIKLRDQITYACGLANIM